MIFYHGTTDIFHINDKRIKSPLETGILREDWRKKLIDKVFITTSFVSAESYAKKACKRFGGNPIIYIVEPIGYCYNICSNEYIADNASIKDSVRVNNNQIVQNAMSI